MCIFWVILAHIKLHESTRCSVCVCVCVIYCRIVELQNGNLMIARTNGVFYSKTCTHQLANIHWVSEKRNSSVNVSMLQATKKIK